MPSTETRSRGVELLLDGPFYAYAEDITKRMMMANPVFTPAYVRKLVKSWADVATLAVEYDADDLFAVTPHMAEVSKAAESLPRMLVSFMSAIGNGRFVQRAAPQENATIEDLVRTRIALVTRGFGADVDVWGVA
ncbi:hypothetical protein ACWDRR_00825 [Kitasatospora sp. NPDC003701]